MGNDENIEPTPRAVSKKDELPYRNTLQKCVDNCLAAIGKSSFPGMVVAFREAMYFVVPGLPFQIKIDEKEKELEDMFQEEIRPFRENPWIWYNPMLKQWHIWDPHYRKHLRLFRFLLGLLARHDALMKARDYVEEGSEPE